MDFELMVDRIGQLCWKTREGELIPIQHLDNNHLRNISLFLIGMGYQECVADNKTRVAWLTLLRMEWERRVRDGRVTRERGLSKWRM